MFTAGIFSLTLAVVLVTSALSGVLGMGGGMILMAFLTLILPVNTAMIVHGSVQAVANGSRSIILFKNVIWQVLPYYSAGIMIGLTLFSLMIFSTEKWLVFLLMGLLPFVPKKITSKIAPNIMRPIHSVACGFSVTLMLLLAGASGPLLDMFFQDTELSPKEIIATKAFAQTVGHTIKTAYYSTLVVSAHTINNEIAVFMLAAVFGTWIGTHILERMDEKKFRAYFRVGIKIIGAVCILKGVSGLIAYAG